MGQQRFIDKRVKPVVVKCTELQIGQLGMVTGHGEYADGMIITKMFDGYVCLYVPSNPNNLYHAFKSTWGQNPGFTVEILPDTCKLELSN